MEKWLETMIRHGFSLGADTKVKVLIKNLSMNVKVSNCVYENGQHNY
jgi:hypothetical protein